MKLLSALSCAALALPGAHGACTPDKCYRSGYLVVNIRSIMDLGDWQELIENGSGSRRASDYIPRQG